MFHTLRLKLNILGFGPKTKLVLIVCIILLEKTESTSESKSEIFDTSYPIIIKDDSATGPENATYFGYTVSLAEAAGTYDDPLGWIYIGAPKSNSTRPMYEVNAISPGVIWRCSLGRGENSGDLDDNCEVVNVDPTPESNPNRASRKSSRPNSPNFESFQNAWVGGTMALDFGRLVTCGMHWRRGKTPMEHYNGMCYWFGDSNENGKRSYTANDLSGLVQFDSYDQRLIPFFKGRAKPVAKAQEDNLFSYLAFNGSDNISKIGYDWRIGQAGISAHIFQDEAKNINPNLLIGAVGVREWAGAVVLYTNPSTPKPEQARSNRNTSIPIFSEFVVGNRASTSKVINEGDRTYWNDFFGYAVTSGRYFSNDKILYAAGAPRALLTGEVVLFQIPPYNKELNFTYKRDIKVELEIPAPKNSFASYFGSVLYTVDLDGDGVDELIVGAPTYTFSSRVKEENSGKEQQSQHRDPKPEKVKRAKANFAEELGDEGCVFIYKFVENGVSRYTSKDGEIEPMQFLVGSKTPRSLFGSAITSIYFHLTISRPELYLVVGAPYEPLEEGTGTGAVYIYLFNHQLGKFSSVIQRIPASQIDPSLNGFGSSLSNPKDIDHNLTPDLTIGSYLSGAAIVLRTRPKILLKSRITFDSDEPEISEVRRGVHQFYIKSCFTVDENLGFLELNLDIWTRVWFSDKTIKFHSDEVSSHPGSSDNEIIYKSKSTTYRKENCKSFRVISKNEHGIGMDESDEIKEILSPFYFFQEVKYNDTLNQNLSPRRMYTRGQTAGQSSVDFKSFGRKKPSPQVSKIQKELRISLTHCRDAVCRPEIHFSWGFLNEKQEKISMFALGSGRDMIMQVNITNLGETTSLPTLRLYWRMTQIKESSSGGRWLQRMCQEDTSDITRKAFACELGQYFKKGRTITINIRFNLDEIYADSVGSKEFNVNGAISFNNSRIGSFSSKTGLCLYVRDPIVNLVGSREDDQTLRSSFKYVTSKYALLENAGERKSETEEFILYSSFRQRFTVTVQGASVNKVSVNLKIPLSVPGLPGPLLMVKGLSMNSENVRCKSVSKGLNFYEIIPHDEYSKQKTRTTRAAVDISPLNAEIGNQTASSCEISMDFKPLKRLPKEEKLLVPENALKLSCESEESCLEVQCIITNLKVDTHAHIPLEMFPLKENVDEVLESMEKIALFVETSAYAQIFDGASAHHEDMDVAQTQLLKIAKQEAALWVYIVAGILGVILLIVIAFGLYKCGFFKREKRQQLNQMKAEHQRKSSIISARASMMLQPRGSLMGAEGDFESQENLTEAEHLQLDPLEEKNTESEPKSTVKIKDTKSS